jgi:hypothetical protein
MGDQIIYGTDERSSRTAGMILWREHPEQSELHFASRVASIRPLRAMLSSNPSDILVTELLSESRVTAHHLNQFKPHAHKIDMGVVKHHLVIYMNNSIVDQLIDLLPQLVHEPDVLYVVISISFFMNDDGWRDLVKLIKAGANTDYVAPDGCDINDLARQMRCYDKYRAALKKARSGPQHV